MNGLLDFAKTPEGQGLLAAVAGGLAGARRGEPINSLGRAGLAGVAGYSSALQAQGISGLRDVQMQKYQTEVADAQRKQAARDAYRNTLPPDQQQLFDVAPDKLIENLPQFQKQQLVEIADPADPLRTQKVWMKPGSTEGTVAGYGALPEILDPRVQAAKRSIAKAGASKSNTNVFNNTKDDFKNERDLRNDFSGLPTTKAFNEVRSAYDQIQTSLQKQSPAGDLAAATKFMKILDPGSVVRESELGMAMAATGKMDRLENYVQMTMAGTKLTPKQRADFGELSQQLYNAAEARYNDSAKEYREVASDYNLNPDRIAVPAALPKKNTSVNVFDNLPKANSLKGKTIRDNQTGKLLRSNGMSWVEVQ